MFLRNHKKKVGKLLWELVDRLEESAEADARYEALMDQVVGAACDTNSTRELPSPQLVLRSFDGDISAQEADNLRAAVLSSREFRQQLRDVIIGLRRFGSSEVKQAFDQYRPDKSRIAALKEQASDPEPQPEPIISLPIWVEKKPSDQRRPGKPRIAALKKQVPDTEFQPAQPVGILKQLARTVSAVSSTGVASMQSVARSLNLTSRSRE